jgi:hypothetical protein
MSPSRVDVAIMAPLWVQGLAPPRQYGSVRHCSSACLGVRQCAVVRQCMAVRGSAAVCGSARSNVWQCGSVRVWQCGSVLQGGSVWQCARLCAPVRVAVCGSAHGSVWQCALRVCTTQSRSQYIYLVCPYTRGDGSEPHISCILILIDKYKLQIRIEVN